MKERFTIAKGYEITIGEDGTTSATRFEERVPYTRTIEKAVKAVKEQRGIMNASTVITVQELEQVKPEKTLYSPSKLWENGDMYFDKEQAESKLKEDDELVESIVYTYTGFLWVLVNEYKYETRYITATSPSNLKKQDQKAALEFELENASPNTYKVVATHDVRKHRSKVWYLVRKKYLDRCVVS